MIGHPVKCAINRRVIFIVVKSAAIVARAKVEGTSTAVLSSNISIRGRQLVATAIARLPIDIDVGRARITGRNRQIAANNENEISVVAKIIIKVVDRPCASNGRGKTLSDRLS